MQKKYFIIAGDPSGDIHAAKLIKAMKAIEPDAEFHGIGGREMEALGFKSIIPQKEISVVGFWEVAKKYGMFRKLITTVQQELKTGKYTAFIPVDYPGFNMKIAGFAKTIGLPVYYYIAPQLWAWGSNRAEKLAASVDKLIVVFPFEVEFFKQYGIETYFCGHPLLDEPIFHNKGISKENIVALLPGSRQQEIGRNLPVMIDSAREFQKKNKEFKIAVAKAGNVSLDKFISDDVQVYSNSRELMKKAKVGIVKTGTSTLEAALCDMPFLMIYKTSPLTYYMGRRLINLDYISLVNILLKRHTIIELFQGEANKYSISKELDILAKDEAKSKHLLEEFDLVRETLGGIGASEKAAELILGFD
jgi:lipid-A-disaccharide synthase